MNLRKNSFQSYDLEIDWLSLKLEGLEDPLPIAKYLLDFGFNSYRQNFPDSTPRIILSRPDNYSEVYFVKYEKSWKGQLLEMRGKNAISFYRLLKEGC